MTYNPNRLLTRRTVEAELGLSRRWLEIAAVRGDGPPFVKINRRVFYRYGDLLGWIAARLTTSTSAQPVMR